MSKTNINSLWRFRFLILILSLLAGAIIFRVCWLTIINRQFLQTQGNARSIRTIDMPAYRGVIYDRHRQVLAVSTPVVAVWAVPSQVDIKSQALARLAKLLHIKLSSLKQKLQKNIKREFVYLKRQVEPSRVSKIKALSLKGVFFRQEFKRFYPQGEAMAHILGFTNIDDKGIEGLELTFNDWLKGVPGKKRVVKDRLGRVIEDVGLIKAPKPGKPLYLSVDKRIQYIAYRELEQTIKKFNAKSGSVVVLDVTSGELLAMVNVPSFNPNKRFKNRDSSYRNSAVTDLFEPGSVMKAFSIASALDSGKFTSKSLINTDPGWFKVDGSVISDERRNGTLSVTQVLQRSSNVGVARMVLASQGQQLVDVLQRVGFGQSTGSGLPGESVGVINGGLDERPFVLATLGFGYGLSVTPLQLAHAYSVLANKGRLLPVSVLKKTGPQKYRQVIPESIANDVLSMLEAVVEKGGTGRRARIKGYRVAGKTGTSRIAVRDGYAKDRHIASFVGIAPVSKPKLIVAVVIREPRQKSYYATVVAAPLFAKVMAGALSVEGILPDKMSRD